MIKIIFTSILMFIFQTKEAINSFIKYERGNIDYVINRKSMRNLIKKLVENEVII